jgi:hypothetical protein
MRRPGRIAGLELGPMTMSPIRRCAMERLVRDLLCLTRIE